MSGSAIKNLTRQVFRDRQKAISAQDTLAPEDRASHPSLLDIVNWPQKWQDRNVGAKYIACYMPLSDELSLEVLRSDLLSHVRFCFPKMEGDEIRFYEASGDSAFTEGRYGVREPKNSENEVAPKEISVMLVPATAYGADGTRLGRGKGFYDRYFARAVKEGFSGFLIGVVPERNLLGSVPADPWDLKVDAICTEKRFLEIRDQEV